jgi:hypothetical protein
MIGFFIIRRMNELFKTTKSVREATVPIFSCKNVGKQVTFRNQHDLWEVYDIENEKKEDKKLSYVCNQFIHSTTSFLFRDETRNWSDVYIVSDFDKQKCIWRVPVAEIREIFLRVSKDYPTSFRIEWNRVESSGIEWNRVESSGIEWNRKKGDYDFLTD